jgi:hypothetical protein
MVTSGRRVNGTKYRRAGCAARNTSEDTVAVRRPEIICNSQIFADQNEQTQLEYLSGVDLPRKYPISEQWK